MKRLILLSCLWTPAHAQLRHSITTDYNAAYFWNAEGGGPLRFSAIYNWFSLPSAYNYTISKNKWGGSMGYTYYETFYGGMRDGIELIPVASYSGYALYSRRYSAVSIHVLRQISKIQRAEFFASAGYIHYFRSFSKFAFSYVDDHSVFKQITNGRNLNGINVGLLARYRLWKGITIQATASHTKLFGGDDFNHVSNLRIGYGYTFGGGMNRTPKRQPAP